MDIRIFVEKKAQFSTEAKQINEAIKTDLNINANLRYLKYYDIFNITQEELDFLTTNVIATSNKDIVTEKLNLNHNIIAAQLLPGTFDNRSASAIACLKLRFNTQVRMYSGEVYIFDDSVDKTLIAQYLINPIEKQQIDLTVFQENDQYQLKTDFVVSDFINFTEIKLSEFLLNNDFTMNLDDLKMIQNYFKNDEKRDPTNLELNMLETYWSDHCRHTTFETNLIDINIEDEKIKNTFDQYLEMHNNLHRKKPITLMDLASIFAKYVIKNNIITDIEVSSEINACSVYVDVDVDGQNEKWLMMFKNETHNHPTEIEPYGGAATCIGGAIRDPLSGRSYVYQAMRISGSKNPLENPLKTLPNKLSQAKISKVSAQGYSSYGNQIGLTTSYVKEIFDDGYLAKHMELGAVVGATKACDVVRKEPICGDVVILVGGRTGKDGIGGASGSSKEHNENTLKTKMAEVQKGNPIEERKLQRLFKNSKVSKMIKKSNDFGAGGVSVAIGEIADSIKIDLSQIKLKYSGLSSFEIALSESQERMAVVVDKNDVDAFIKLAIDENLEAIVVAYVTDSGRLEMEHNGEIIVSLKREFIDTNGAVRNQTAHIKPEDKIKSRYTNNLVESFSNLNGASQAGLQRMFDSTIGAGTVLVPYGGIYQKTPEDVSVVKFPVESTTKTASALAYGYHPQIAKQSPYLGAMYANVSAIAKLVAVGCSLDTIKFTYQEYFPKLGTDPLRWGMPLASLLGAFKVQSSLNLPAIGGKDSMSGSFKQLDVPPTLVAFAINTINTSQVISSEIKQVNSNLYITNIKRLKNQEFDFESVKQTYSIINKLVKKNQILSMKAVDIFGLSHTISQMSFGNKIGAEINTSLNLYDEMIGDIIIETIADIHQFTKVGQTNNTKIISLNDEKYAIDQLIEISDSILEPLYKTKTSIDKLDIKLNLQNKNKEYKFPTPHKNVEVVIPVFPGTNCEYDMQRAFKQVGAHVEQVVIQNINNKLLESSLEQFVLAIEKSDIIALSGGFSLGDEPDGSGKFIANILRHPKVKLAITNHLKQKKLIIGICNGFQALIESGLLPFNQLEVPNEHSPILFRNDLNEHVADIVKVKITANNSPWLSSHKVGSIYNLPISHGEGKFVCNDQVLNQLITNNQIFSQYCDHDGNISNDPQYNLNGSINAIEGLVSPCGLIIGKMGHNERYTNNTLINTYGEYDTKLFINAINYIKGE